MFARFFEVLNWSRGQKALALAVGCVMAVSAGICLMIVAAMTDGGVLLSSSYVYELIVIVSGGLAAGIALYLVRNWMGGQGALGYARSVVAAIMVLGVMGLVAGTLVSPINGTMAGPLVVVSEFMARPLLAMGWFVVIVGSHSLMVGWRSEQADADRRASGSAISQLSSLTRQNLYSRN